MKVVVISDSHGNIENLKHVLGFAKKIKVDAIIHCGDWNNALAAETVLNSGLDLYTVLGNADISEDLNKILEKKSRKFDKKFLKIELGGRKIGIIHKINQLEVNTNNLDIVFFGHWHRQKEMIKEGIRVVNPGALENEIYFALYDTKTNKVELMKI